MENEQRLSKIMSQRGICSRREADRLIKQGQVIVEGKPVTILGSKVSIDAKIQLLEKAERAQFEKVTLLLHKPVGYVSCQPEKNYVEALSLIKKESQDPSFFSNQQLPKKLIKLAVAGRLDIDSKGLLVFTQDGRVAKRIIGENSEIEKEYLVRIEGTITPDKVAALTFGLSLDGKPLKKAVVEVIDQKLLKFVLKEGKKRQIRRMCELVQLKVTSIKRVRIGGVKLGSLKPGMWRFLNIDETF